MVSCSKIERFQQFESKLGQQAVHEFYGRKGANSQPSRVFYKKIESGSCKVETISLETKARPKS